MTSAMNSKCLRCSDMLRVAMTTLLMLFVVRTASVLAGIGAVRCFIITRCFAQYLFDTYLIAMIPVSTLMAMEPSVVDGHGWGGVAGQTSAFGSAQRVFPYFVKIQSPIPIPQGLQDLCRIDKNLAKR
jgi:hypothetical protein